YEINKGIVNFKYKLNKNSSFFNKLKLKRNKVSQCTMLQIFVQFVVDIHKTRNLIKKTKFVFSLSKIKTCLLSIEFEKEKKQKRIFCRPPTKLISNFKERITKNKIQYEKFVLIAMQKKLLHNLTSGTLFAIDCSLFNILTRIVKIRQEAMNYIN
ncbi:hypothetical protein BpHYR1_018247, partial [Brachionus plicatilis]